MYKLRKFYMDNVGSVQLGFDNVTLDFVDEFTGKVASDCIVSADNGDGKTTILSLFFTLLKPHKDKFIQRIQRDNHHFDEYIRETPGLLLAEFAHHKEDGIGTWIIGQYLMMKSDGNSHREFFCFQGSIGGAGFDSVPSIGRGTLDKKEDIRAFLNAHPSVFVTQDQSDWEKHLNEIGFDYKEIETQIQFCRSEGGIDSFCDFNSETQFLETLFDLTMPDGDNEEISRQINTVIEKNQELPKFEKQVSELKEVMGLIRHFVEQSVQSEAKHKELNELSYDVRGYWRYANQELNSLNEQVSKINEVLSEKKVALKLLKKLISTNQKKMSMLNLRKLRINIGREEDAQAKKLEEQVMNEKNEMLIDLAKYYLEYQEALRLYQQKAETMIALTRDLDVFRGRIDNLKIHRSKVMEGKWNAILVKINELKEQGQIISVQITSEKAIGLEAKAKQDEQGRAIHAAEFFINQHNKEEEQLLKKGWLDPNMELNQQASQLKIALDDLDARIKHNANRLLKEREEYRVKKSEHQSHQYKLGEMKTELAGAKKLEENFLRQEFSVREALSRFLQLPIEEVSAYGRYVENNLLPLINAQQVAMTEFNREKYRLSAEYEAIESSNGLMVDAQVAALKEQLDDAGINSKFALDYLIEIENDDVGSVAKIVATDPGRYLGLMVNNQATLDEIQAKAGTWKINKPVVVSLTDNTEGQLSSEMIVVAPLSNVLYSRAETEQYLDKLTSKIEQISEQIKQKQSVMDGAQKLKFQLEDFYRQHPELDVLQRKEDIRVLTAKVSIASDELAKLTDELQEQEIRITRLDDSVTKERLILANDTKKSDAIREFRDNYASKLSSVIHNLKVAKETLSTINVSIEQSESAMGRLREKLSDNAQSIQMKMHEATECEKDVFQHGITSEQRKTHQYESTLLEQSIEQIDSEIRTAERDLNAKEQDAGYAINQSELDSLNTQQERAREIFIGQKKEIHESAIAAIATGKSMTDLANEKSAIRLEYSAISKELAEISVKITTLLNEAKAIESSSSYSKTGYDAFDGESLAMIKEIEEEISAELANQESEEVAIIELVSSQDKELIEKKDRQNKFAILEAALSGVVADKSGPGEAQYIDAEDAKEKIDLMSNDIKRAERDAKALEKTTRESYAKFLNKVNQEGFKASNPEVMGIAQTEQSVLAKNGEALCADLSSCINFIEGKIEGASDNITRAASVLQGKVSIGLRRLRDACGIRLPAEMEDVGGLHVLKISAEGRRVLAMEEDMMIESLGLFIRKCIKNNHYPRHLLTEAIITLTQNFNPTGLLELRILQIREGSHDYYLVSDIKSSGGERLTTALLLYVTVSNLSGKNSGTGGFIFTDNICGKCNKADFIRAQLKLSKALGFQLISTTGLMDKSFMSQYSKILNVKPRRRKLGKGRVINESGVFKGMYETEVVTAE